MRPSVADDGANRLSGSALTKDTKDTSVVLTFARREELEGH